MVTKEFCFFISINEASLVKLSEFVLAKFTLIYGIWHMLCGFKNSHFAFYHKYTRQYYLKLFKTPAFNANLNSNASQTKATTIRTWKKKKKIHWIVITLCLYELKISIFTFDEVLNKFVEHFKTFKLISFKMIQSFFFSKIEPKCNKWHFRSYFEYIGCWNYWFEAIHLSRT